jgi:PKD repeat protein
LKKVNYLLLALLFVAASVNASFVTHQLAQTVATNFYGQNIGAGNPNLSLVYTAYDANSNPDYYVFNAGANNGFIIVPADDAAHPILGYSKKGQYVIPTDNNNVAWWMNCRKQEIEYARKHNISADQEISSEWSRYIYNTVHPNVQSFVNPLVQTTWNQSPNYNAWCPGGSVTGCVATAMAQILYYWQYPTHGHGNASYYDLQMYGYQRNYGLQTVDFDSSHYVWSGMPLDDTVPNNYVAELMYDCGVSVSMDYSPGGSGAWVITHDYPVCAQNSYVKYFGYNPYTIQGLYEKNYTLTNWINLIENELNNSRPVQYVGYDSATNEGHTWVCDGYDASNNFDMNWGWGGGDNGYYAPTSLNTGWINLSWWCEAVVGIEPPASSPYFSGSPRFGCGALTVNYTDMSVANSPINTYKWLFPGGNPGTSPLANPSVIYNAPGTYDVTEIVTSLNGTDSLTMKGYVSVGSSGSLALSQGFQSPTFPPTGWVNYNPTNSNYTWQLNTTVGGFGNSSQCMFFNNGLAKGIFQSLDEEWVPGKAAMDVIGQRQRIFTPSYDFTGVNYPEIYFDVAYAPYNATYSDSLAIYYSTDCGNTWNQVYFKGGMTLCTTGNTVMTGADTNAIGLFVPLSNNWRTDTIKIPAIAYATSVMFAFENRSGNGSPIYIDNINIPGAPLKVSNISNSTSVSVFPNPSNGKFTVELSGVSGQSLVEIYNVLGEKVYTGSLSSSTTQIDLSTKASGVYLYRIISLSGNLVSTGRLVIE